jgi:hypothetical protein
MKRIALLTAVALLVGQALVMGAGSSATPERARSPLPFTFFMTRYEMLGDPNDPSGVRYHNDGAPFADDPNTGERIAVSGRGAWDPAGDVATGGGTYVISNRKGNVVSEGRWTVLEFRSFLQLPGWFGIDGFEEKGWQGPPGSVSFSGFLKLRVKLDDGRRGVLTSWCIMPTTPHVGGHVSDGISLTGKGLSFSDSTATEMSLEGMMFYGPGSDNN